MWLSKKHWVSVVLAIGAAATAISGHDGAGSFLLAIILIELFA